MKKVVLGFGRMNPPTTGHEVVANKIAKIAKSMSATPRLYLSHTTNPKKDPLSYDDKIKFAKLAFSKQLDVVKSNARTIIEVMKSLDKEGFTDVTLVVGSDRVDEFKRLLDRYNGKDFSIDNLEVISAGERDPDAEGVTGMSASKMRAFASKNDYASFKQGVPKNLSDSQAKELYDSVRKGMRLTEETEIDEVLTMAQRRRRAMVVRRIKSRLQRTRKLAMKRFASQEKLKRRARRTAIKFLKKRFGGGKSYASLSTGQKIAVDRKVERMKDAIAKISARMLPKVRKAEIERKAAQRASSQRNEEFEQFFEAKTAQDADIASRKGTQPAKYFKGMDRETKERRDAHFKKMGPRSDRDPSAYADAPGDKEAREKEMPKSKYTKKFKQMYGEEVSRKEMSRLDQLVRMGLADKKLLPVIKRGVSKLDSGEALNPNERKAALDLLQTLLDMTLSQDQLFRMARTQLQKEETLDEAFEMFVEDEFEDERVDQDGRFMAVEELRALIDDAEEALVLLEEMDEEPDAWVSSKITKAADYISTVTDYLEYSVGLYDDDDDDEDEEDDDFEEAVYEAILEMSPEELGDLSEEFSDIREEIEGLRKKAEKSGISYSILKQVYDRGMAAWQGGHRPGTTPQQWAFARVNSFITGGKTRTTADADLWKKVNRNEQFESFVEALEIGTDEIRIAYARATPGQSSEITDARYSANNALETINNANMQRRFKLFSEEMNIHEAIQWHISNDVLLQENVYRVGSEKYFELYREARKLYNEGALALSEEDRYLIEETDLGEFAHYEGKHVPLDCPMLEEEEEKDPPLNQPKRGGPKKFYVFVRKPDGGIKKVTWGDTSGLSVKMNDPEARKSFAARHQCSTQKDRTSAAYWACNTPRYAKQLGLSGGGNFFW